MANGLYNSKGVGASQLPQQVAQTPFGKVVTSGGIYKGSQEANYTPTGGGWGTASWGNSSSSLSNILGGIGGVSSGQSLQPSAGSQAIGAYKDAIATLQGGVDSANAAVNLANKHIISADNDLNAARLTASSLSPLAESLRGAGGSMLSLYDQLIRGDEAAGGIAGDYLGAIRLAGDAALNITPDRYVASAASDVQNSFNNAQGQAERELSRRGVGAGSGASMALRQQLMQSLATALAAAKTKARQTGIDAQLNALTQRAGLFKDVMSTAQSLAQSGSENIANSANIIENQGQMYTNIGGVEVNLGQLEVNNNKLVQDAIGNVAAAQQALAKFYADTMPETTVVDKSGFKDDVTTTKSFAY